MNIKEQIIKLRKQNRKLEIQNERLQMQNNLDNQDMQTDQRFEEDSYESYFPVEQVEEEQEVEIPKQSPWNRFNILAKRFVGRFSSNSPNYSTKMTDRMPELFDFSGRNFQLFTMDKTQKLGYDPRKDANPRNIYHQNIPKDMNLNKPTYINLYQKSTPKDIIEKWTQNKPKHLKRRKF